MDESHIGYYTTFGFDQLYLPLELRLKLLGLFLWCSTASLVASIRKRVKCKDSVASNIIINRNI